MLQGLLSSKKEIFTYSQGDDVQNNIEDEKQAHSQVFLWGGAIQRGCD